MKTRFRPVLKIIRYRDNCVHCDKFRLCHKISGLCKDCSVILCYPSLSKIAEVKTR